MKDPAFGPIRDLVRDFANSTIPIEPGTEVLGTVIDNPKIVTVYSVARATGTIGSMIRGLVARQGLAEEAFNDGPRNHRVTIDADKVAPIVTKLRDALTAPQAMKLLGGISRSHLKALIAVGALPTIGSSEKQPHAKHRFARSDIDAMLERLFNESVEVATPGSRQMSIAGARQAAVAGLEDLLAMVSVSLCPRLLELGRESPAGHREMAVIAEARGDIEPVRWRRR